MNYIALPNPLWSCQLQILGGQRRLGIIAVVYTAVLIALIMMFRLPFRDQQSHVFAHWALKWLAGWQCLLMTLGGCTAISKALFRDHQTRMIESHRTSPMSGLTVAFGYIVGPNIQVLMLMLIGCLFGCVLTWIAQDDMQLWLMGHIFLLTVMLSVWSAAVFFAIGTRQRRSQYTALLSIGAVTSWAWVSVVPGLAVLTGMASILWCYGFMLAVPRVSALTGVILGLAVGMSIFWIGATARRYRHPYLSPLNPLSAAVLVAIWVIVSAIVLRLSTELATLLPRMFALEPAVICLPISALLLALLPFAMAMTSHRWALQGGTRSGDGAIARTWRWAAVGGGLYALALPCLWLVAGVDPEIMQMTEFVSRRGWQVMLASGVLGIIVACAVIQVSVLLSGKHIVALLALFLLWVAPPAIDAIHAGATQPEVHLGALSGMSPGGMVILLFLEPDPRVWPGLAFQGVVAVVVILLAARARAAVWRRSTARD